MSHIPVPLPAEVATRAVLAIRSLTDEQLAAVMASSRKIKKRRRALPICWSTVTVAAPELARAMDDLHASEISNDLPRFEALAENHENRLARAMKGRTGKLTALSVLAAFIAGIAAAVLGIAEVISLPATVFGGVLSAGLFASAYIGGRRLARQGGSWMFADPKAAAAIVWDAGIDATTAAALAGRAGSDGLTPKVLQTLCAVWKGAGLEPGRLGHTDHNVSGSSRIHGRRAKT